MKLYINRFLPALGLLGLGLAGCQPDIEAPTASAGSADFSRYIAVGNSLTAGFSDGGLYNEAQATSYPAILAQQFGKTSNGPASFVQPSFSPAKEDGSGYLKLLLVNGALTPVQPTPPPSPTNPNGNSFLGEKVAFTGVTLPGGPQLEAYTGTQPDNLGVPGISVLSSVSALTGGLAPYGAINPFYERLLTATEKPTKDYVTYISQKSASFFTCWMGNNDVLAYATNGGVVDVSATGPNPFGNLTDSTRFGIGYRAILRTLTKAGTVPGVAANIPNVTNIPYFTTVTSAAVVAKYNKAGIPITAIYIQARTSASSPTTAPRAATAADLLTLTSQAFIGANPGVGTSPTAAIPSKYVLDPIEQGEVAARTTQLNGIIAKTARQNKVALADMNAFFNSIVQQGVVTDAVSNSATFASGNLFSLDGVHPTPRGYALIANEFIRVINTSYGASVPTVNANSYRGVVFPQ